ncbi:glycosyltransferase family 2 protein [Acinetobacter genomosp. 15BJ]|uniref:Glycosyltransferase family 2 protein n=1 Tax=Acinetobacter genomosp. 15BJ TaxID=106651 RepID=A0ABT8UYU5_9GAMM|nr:glycosyltransferase family 2 protein [Acinetobacter genomosp. 15BJ]MDO3658223.1 glycosyltransferase family 2 protein [Acinetobacter genomosp. 15BJ]
MNDQCSIIIPLYNEEKNIDTCFEVLKGQTYRNIEILFINDGSTDNSEEILQRKIIENPHLKIRLLSQENLGAAEARRNGIANATSDYITILDCDDELSNDAINLAMELFDSKKDTDIVLFDLKYQSKIDLQTKKINDFTYYTDSKEISGADALKNSLDKWGVHGLGIYRKDIMLKSYEQYEKFNKENLINNDEIITRLCFMNSRYVLLSKGVYFYNNNPFSTTKRINSNLYKKIYNSIILYEILLEKAPKIANTSLIMSYTWEAYRYFTLYKTKLLNSSDWEAAIQKGVNMIKFKDLVFYLSFKARIQYFLLLVSGYRSL